MAAHLQKLENDDENKTLRARITEIEQQLLLHGAREQLRQDLSASSAPAASIRDRAAESMWAGPELEKRAFDEDRNVTVTNPSLCYKPQGYLVTKNKFFLYGSELQEQEEMAAHFKAQDMTARNKLQEQEEITAHLKKLRQLKESTTVFPPLKKVKKSESSCVGFKNLTSVLLLRVPLLLLGPQLPTLMQ